MAKGAIIILILLSLYTVTQTEVKSASFVHIQIKYRKPFDDGRFSACLLSGFLLSVRLIE